MSAPFRMLIVSDIHAFSARPPDAEEPSYAKANTAQTDPFGSLEELIGAEIIEDIDLVICAGDICDQADAQGLVYAWQRLTAIAASLGAQLIATAGNHDLDSRFMTSDYNPKGALQRLNPPFPHSSAGASDMYWARNFWAMRMQESVVVTLNSAAFHGYHNDERFAREFLYGRVAPDTVDELSTFLRTLGEATDHRVLVCHHHPQLLGPFRDVEGDSAMRDGHLLLDRLKSDLPPWLIVHGHRHYPHLAYAPGGATAPVVFSAGSFARRLGDIYQNQVQNQFYEIELIGPDMRDELALDIGGRFRSWTWGHSEGWIAAPPRTGLPKIGGFGQRSSVGSLVRAVKGALAACGVTGSDWGDLCAVIPVLKFVIPDDLRSLFARLEGSGVTLDPPASELYTGDLPSRLALS